MKKLLLVAILMLALVLTVAACKTEPGTTETTVGETTAAPAPVDSTATPDADTTAEPPADTTAEPPADTTAETPADTTAEPETTTEEVTTADPAEPVVLGDAAYLAGVASGNGIAGAELMEEGGKSFVRVTVNNADPQINVASNLGVLPNYLAIAYRTTAELDGEMFIGTANGPNGQNDHVNLTWIEDGNWNLVVVDLSTVENVTDGNIGYFRLDPFRGQTEGYIDIAYIGFFNTAEYAILYDAAPALIVTPDDLAAQYAIGQATSVNNVGSAEIKTDADAPYIRLTTAGGDPYITVVPIGSGKTLPKYMAVSYRTNGALDGQFFMGSGSGWTGAGDAFGVTWNEDGKWNLLVVDLTTVEGLTSITDGLINYARMDFFTGAGEEGDYFDVSYIGFFESEADAAAYFSIKGLQPKDIKNTFASDLASNAADTTIDATDLKNGFTFFLNLGDYKTSATSYKLNGISEMFTDVNGKYALTVNFAEGRNGNYYAIARGVHAVETNGTVDFTIKNFYETDGNGPEMGGAGIYARIHDNELKIVVKLYDGEKAARIKNETYTLPCEGTTLTMADDGSTVYILVDGVTYATITMSGETEYDGFANVSPATTFAKTAVVALKDGTTATLENTLVDSTCNTQTGIVVRSGEFLFDSIKLEAFSAVEIPEMVLPAPAPEMPAEFTLSLVQGNLEGKTLYFAGAKSGNFLATTENAEEATTVYSEKTEDGWVMYFMDGETKAYIVIHEWEAGRNGVELITEAPSTFFQWNEDANTWTVWLEGCENNFYLGTYNTFNTISSSKIDYITGDKAADVGVSQFVVTWNAIEAAE